LSPQVEPLFAWSGVTNLIGICSPHLFEQSHVVGGHPHLDDEAVDE
jgi:hypothetical protein